MLQRLENHDGFTRYAVTSPQDLDPAGLVTLMADAWQADYQVRVHFAFDAPFLRWLLVEPGCIGGLLCDQIGCPVGFEAS
ncbi:hypothetical protein NKDENANG_02206 [Candidatus Entotheonellaceae bacterium PAL068K]